MHSFSGIVKLAYHLLLIAVIRHWLIGIENAAFTAAIGIGALNLFSWLQPALFTQRGLLGLKRGVLLISLAKSAIYLVAGESRPRPTPWCAIYGVHFPSPTDWPNPHGVLTTSIWSTTPLTHGVSFTLAAYAAYRLIRRANMVTQASRLADKSWRSDVHDNDVADLQNSIDAAAVEIGRPELRTTEAVVLDRWESHSPFVLGIAKPRIVIAREHLRLLRDAGCLGAALRHELMHIRRKDHVLRWVQVWMEDIARITLVAPRLSTIALGMEEHLCDIGSITKRADAAQLARAIAICDRAARTPNSGSPRNPSRTTREQIQPPPQFADAVLPGLLGLRECARFEERARLFRMRAIESYAKRLAGQGASADSIQAQADGRALGIYLRALGRAAQYTSIMVLRAFVFVVLFFDTYAKFILIVNV